MANITLLGTPTNTLSTGATVKGSPLTVLQVDDNFNNINAALIQSVTINGSAVQLGGSITVTANTTNALTAGTGITSGGTFNGATARTFAIDTGVVATLSGTQTLTNKTISGASNTLSAIPNSSLTNSSVTINGSAVSLGGSINVDTRFALTAGTGLSSTGTFNGSAARTFSIDSTVATLTGTQTLTNKTISGASNTILQNEHMIFAVSDETTAITTGTSKITFRAPFAMELYAVPRASLSTASTANNPTIDINVGGTSIFGAQKLYIPVNVKTSKDAAGQAALTSSPLSVADDAEITVDIDTAGTGAKGLKIVLYFRRTA